MRIHLQCSHLIRWKLLVVAIIFMHVGGIGTDLPSALAQSSVHITDSQKKADQHEYLSRLGVSDENLLKLTKRISLDFQDEDVKNVLKYITEQAGLTLAYNSAVWEREEKVSVKADNTPVLDALFATIKNTTLSFRLSSFGQLIVARSFQPVRSDETREPIATHLVSGVVTSREDGMPLPGVNILVKGSVIGTTTNESGEYSIDTATPRDTLVFSYVGYVTQEVYVQGRTQIDVVLDIDSIQFDELVVIGYGERARQEVTGSISSVDTDILENTPNTGFDLAIAGLLPGVRSVQVSGAPGENADIRIRGISTLTAGVDPLIVLDGVPLAEGVNLSIINPNDIASIDVLKDAAATAIYGSRGANGVLLITTKNGEYGQATEFSFSTYQGVQSVSQTVDLMDAYEMAQYIAASRNNGWVNLDPANHSSSDPNEMRDARYQIPDYVQPYLDGTQGLTNTDWQDAIFRNAPSQNYQLSMSGSGAQSRYYLSGNYTDQQGIIENTDFERYSLRGNMEMRLAPRLKVGINAQAAVSNGTLTNPGGHWQNGVVIGTFFAQPFFPVYNQDGSFQLTEMLGAVIEDRAFRRAVQNPVAIASMEERTRDEFRVIGGGFAELDLGYGLTLKSSFGLDRSDIEGTFFRPAGLGFYNNLPPATSAGNLENRTLFSWLSENTLSYDRLIGEGHNFNVLAGYTYQEADLDWSQIEAQDFQNDRVQTLNGGVVQVANTFSRASSWSLVSLIGRISYDYQSRYLLTASLRRDGSSRFGNDSRWALFPAVSVAWRAGQEPFMDSIEGLNELKFRASFGETGNNQIGDFASKSLLTSANYVVDGELVSGLAPGSLPNDQLSWETTTMLNLGVDVELFDRRLAMTLDYYDAETNDLLLQVPVPASSGYTSSLTNIGKVSNNGLEFLIRGNLNLGPVVWEPSFNIATNRNEVLELGPDQEQIISGGVFVTRVGEPIASHFGYNVVGVFQSEEQLASTPSHPRARVGSYIYEDINGDGTITADDRTILGDNFPDFTYGFSSRFSLNGIDLNVVFQGVEGNQVYLNNAFTYYNIEAWTNMHRDLLQAIDDPTNSVYAQPNIDQGETLWQSSNLKFADASFLRLRTLTLGYSLPQRWLRSVRADQVRIYLTGQNLFTSTDYPGYNPDVSDDNGTVLQLGRAWSEYPLARTYTFGLDVRF